MNVQIGRKLAMLLMVAAGCGSSGSRAAGAPGGTGAAGTGAAGTGAAGTGAAGTGAAGTGAAGTGVAGTGAAGTGAAGTGAAGTGAAGTGVAGGGAGGAGWLTPPPMPPGLVAPAGATVKVHVHAVGAQVYSCAASGGGGADGSAPTYVWTFKAPDAKLYDASGAQVGTHGAGPSWTASDGSVANGTKVTELPSPLPDAISWLLLRVSSTSGAGLFSDVTYVQRLDTAGGRAPVTGCDPTTIGMDLRVSYTAEYYLYTGGGAASWLVPPSGLPDAIAAPTSLVVKRHDRGIGMQIYACTANAAGYAWVFKAPNALLYDQNYVPVGSHGEGPSWTSSDGSSLTAKLLAQVDSPLPDAIPWLLLKEFSTTGVGEFDDVGIVQRLNTAGGKAPTTGCDATTVDTLARVPYAADYYFYVDFTPPDAGSAD